MNLLILFTLQDASVYNTHHVPFHVLIRSASVIRSLVFTQAPHHPLTSPIAFPQYNNLGVLLRNRYH